jgi:putative hydrolase of the HAD superfamily
MTGNASNGRIPLRGVVFDYGNVLCRPQQPSDVERMSQICGMPAARFRELYWKFRTPYDRGDLDGKSYWSLLGREDGRVLAGEQIGELILLDARSWSRPNAQSLAWVKQLHGAGLQLALLSNMPLEISRVLTAEGEWAPFFAQLTFSCDVRRVKPDAAIYQACLGKMKLAAEQVLFLDDVHANIEGAEAVGMHGMIFDTAEDTASRAAARFAIPIPELGVSS